MYIVLRCFIVCLLLFVVLLISRFLCQYKRKVHIVSIVLLIVLFFASVFTPLENTILTFSKPQHAFNYYNPGYAKATFYIIDGKSSSLVLAEKQSVFSKLIIPKTPKGWKIGIGSDMLTILETTSDRYVIHIYQHRQSKDYYISVLNTGGEQTELVDSLDSYFQSVPSPSLSLATKGISYYAYLSDLKQDYWLSINGKKLLLGQKTGDGSLS